VCWLKEKQERIRNRKRGKTEQSVLFNVVFVFEAIFFSIMKNQTFSKFQEKLFQRKFIFAV